MTSTRYTVQVKEVPITGLNYVPLDRVAMRLHELHHGHVELVPFELHVGQEFIDRQSIERFAAFFGALAVTLRTKKARSHAHHEHKHKEKI